MKCKFGKLKSPIKGRRCKLKPKNARGRSIDRGRKSSEFHEVRYRRDKRLGKR